MTLLFNYFYILILMKKEIERLSKELNLPKKVIERVYNSYWKFIKTTIEALPLKEDITEEEFKALKTNFNIPYLGKLYCTYDKWKSLKEVYKIKSKENAKHKKNKTT